MNVGQPGLRKSPNSLLENVILGKVSIVSKCQIRLNPNPHCFNVYVVLYITKFHIFKGQMFTFLFFTILMFGLPALIPLNDLSVISRFIYICNMSAVLQQNGSAFSFNMSKFAS